MTSYQFELSAIWFSDTTLEYLSCRLEMNEVISKSSCWISLSLSKWIFKGTGRRQERYGGGGG